MRLFYLTLCLLFTSLAFSNSYYISASGNDNNNGLSVANAWKTIDKVNSFTFAPGDIIAFEGGSVFSGSIDNRTIGGTPGQIVTITSYGTGKATILSGMNKGIDVVHSGNVTISKLKFQGSGYNITDLNTHGMVFYIDTTYAANIENITVDSVEVTGYGGWGIVFYNDAQQYGFKNITVTNSDLHDNGWGGLWVYGSYNMQTASVNITHSNFLISHLKAYNNFGRKDLTTRWSGGGIYLSGIDHGSIEYCETYNNGKENGSSYAGPIGIFTSDSKYLNIDHCISHNNFGGPAKKDGGGFGMDQGSYGCNIQYCESYDNEGAAFGLYNLQSVNPWGKNTVRFNTSTNDARNYSVYGSLTFWGRNSSAYLDGAEVYGNRITMNKAGYSIRFINNYAKNVNIYDNEFCMESPAKFVNLEDGYPISSFVDLWNNKFTCTEKPSVITPVNFRGAFGGQPYPMWTVDWSEYNPQQANYAGTDSVLQGTINADLKLSGSKTYVLNGPVFVASGKTLTIEGGCIIKGAKNIIGSALIISQGAKLNAMGNPFKPVIFTSDQAIGARNEGDWGGIYILGKSHYNGTSGQAYLPGFSNNANALYGGGTSPLEKDNSGQLEYVRIEFAGADLANQVPGAGLLLCAAGESTVVDHMQVSFSKGNAFSWIGGGSNSYFLVAYKARLNNWFATDGYNGAVQFGLGLKDPSIASTIAGKKSNGFEVQNDNSGSANLPFTAPVFSNITDIGPLRGNPSSSIASGYGTSVHLINGGRARILNSIILDFPTGLYLDGSDMVTLAQGSFLQVPASNSPGNLIFKNNLLAGNAVGRVLDRTQTWDIDAWFRKNRNDSLVSTAGLLEDPYLITSTNVYNGDYRGKNTSLKKWNWNDSAFFKIATGSAMVNIISCPITPERPDLIKGPLDKCSSFSADGENVYYLNSPSKFGILRYDWEIPDGVEIISGQGTDTLTVRYNPGFSSGTLRVINRSYCGKTGSARTLAISQVAGLGADTTLYVVCNADTANLTNLYNTTGLANAAWNTATPSSVQMGVYKLTATTSNGCVDTATALVKQDINIWQGGISSDWHNAANWKTGKIPTVITHVIIPGGTAKVCEISAQDANAASVQVQNGAKISLLNSHKLLINGKCNPLPSTD